jgi:type I restriction enzyme S subunit
VKLLKLVEVCNLVGGGTPSKANSGFYLGDIPWATVRDMRSRWLEDTEHKINEVAVRQSSTNVIPAGNVVLASRVGLGKVVQLKRDTAINQDLRALIPRQNSNVDSSYLYYWTLSISPQIISAGKGATVQGVTLPFLENLEIPVPTIDKQKEIVKRLDKAFAEIDSLEKNLRVGDEKANQLLQSLLSSAFSSTAEDNGSSNNSEVEMNSTNLVPLGTVAEVIAGQSPEGIYYNSIGNGTPFYQGKKEFGEKFLGEATTWTTKITKLAEPGDILMSVRAPVGPINFSTQQICIGRGLAAIRAEKLVDKNYLFYFLLHKQPEISGNTGAVFDSINKDQISSIEIPVPSLEKQIEIINKLDIAFAEIESLKLQIKSERDYAVALRQSILSSAFTLEEAVA